MLFSLCLIHISSLSVITLTSPTLNCSLILSISYLGQHIHEINEDDGNNNGYDTHEEAVDHLHDKEGMIESSFKEVMYPFSKLSRWSFLGPKYLKCYKVLDRPIKLYNINDAQGLHPFMVSRIENEKSSSISGIRSFCSIFFLSIFCTLCKYGNQLELNTILLYYSCSFTQTKWTWSLER
jgi:hypothetical protein